MKIWARSTALIAALLLTAQPCLAAELASNEFGRRSGAFAAAYVRIPLTGRKGPSDEARAGLRLGVSQVYGSVNTGTGERRQEAGLVDLGMFRSGRPSLTVGGRQLIDKKGRLSLQGDDADGGGVSPWLIVGGVVAAIGVGSVVWWDSKTCSRDEAIGDECDLEF